MATYIGKSKHSHDESDSLWDKINRNNAKASELSKQNKEAIKRIQEIQDEIKRG